MLVCRATRRGDRDIEVITVTPTSCREAPARWARDRCRWAALRQSAAVDVVEKAKDLAATFRSGRETSCSTGERALPVVGTPALSRSWAELAEAAAKDGTALFVRWISPRRSDVIPSYPHLGRRSRHRDRQGECAATHRGGRRGRYIIRPPSSPRPGARGIAQGVAQALLEEVVYDSTAIR